MTTPAGWYDDPEDSNGQRYWDGRSWTPHRQRKPVSVQSPAPASPPPPPNQQAAWQPPGQQPAGPSPTRSTNPLVIIGLVVAIGVLAAGALFAYKHFGKSHPSSPEDQIKAVIQHEADDWNKSNFAYNPDLYCKANSALDNAQMKEVRNLRAQAGTLAASVTSVHVTGDQANVDVTYKFEKVTDNTSVTLQFVKEDGRWKDCTPPDSSDTGDGQ